MTPQCCLVTESSWDETLLRCVLSSEISTGQVMTISSPGSAAAASTARSFLVVKKMPVALVVDSDVLEDDAVNEKRTFLENALRPYSAGIEFLVLAVVPEIESCFFENPAFLEAVGLPTPDAVTAERARYRPKQVLNELLEIKQKDRRSMKWISELPVSAIEILREVTPFKELVEFIQNYVFISTK
mgnify:CR=1 FL=1